MKRNLPSSTGFNVSVKAVVGDVEFAFYEPFREGEVPFEDRFKVFKPGD